MSRLAKAIWDNWRSVVSYVLTFFVVGVLLIYEPDWVTNVAAFSGGVKNFVIDTAHFFGWDSLAGVFSIGVADTAIAWATFMLITRALIITTVVWVSGAIFRAVTGRGGES